VVSVSIDTAKLDALFVPFTSNDRPGIAVGIAHKGVPVYRRGFGLASVELPEPLSPTIRMRIGSTSKHFTCLCIMLLAEEGKLSPEDSVRKHLPELKAWADGIHTRRADEPHQRHPLQPRHIDGDAECYGVGQSTAASRAVCPSSRY
jgi:CubicO group peptidase (beta-lactamase class C family)